MKSLTTIYGPHYANIIAYMLQDTGYSVDSYLHWYWRTTDFSRVMRQWQLAPTAASRVLRTVLWAGMMLQLATGLAFIVLWLWQGQPAAWQYGLALVISYPVVWAHLILIPVLIGRGLVLNPRRTRAVKRSVAVFAEHKGLRIGLVGGYGKANLKQLLLVALSSGVKVAAPADDACSPVALASFADSLQGDEEMLVIPYDEQAAGDVTRFAHQTLPTHGIVTGVTAVSGSRYKNVEAAALDAFSLALALPAAHFYANADSQAAKTFISQSMRRYDAKGALGWRVTDSEVSLEGVSFAMKRGSQKYRLRSNLLGRHQIGPLVFAAAFAMEQGIDSDKVLAALAYVEPRAHCMQPRQRHGAWIIDDTQAHDIEAVKAGTALLAELAAERKWYATPGLGERGGDMRKIHVRMGELIAAAEPDVVVLVANNSEQYIRAGLRAAEFQGSVRVEDSTQEFETNLMHHLAAGDLVLMQGDWTDSYD